MPGDPPALRSWTLDLDLTKPLSMNDRQHWRPKAKAVRAVREATYALARQARIPALGRVSIELHYAPRDNRRRDAINLAATVKPIEDGLVDAGVVPDDTAEYVEPTHAVIDPPTRAATGRLYVIVRELV